MNRRRTGGIPASRLGFSGSSLLRDAVVDDDSSLITELLSSRKRLKITSLDVNEVLLKACKYGSTACVRTLLKDSTVHVDYQDEDLWTSLHMASASGHDDIVQLLIQSKSDPNLLDIDGHFALDYATNTRTKKLLLNHMAENGVHPEDFPSIKSRLPRAMLAAVASGIRRNKDLTAHNKNGVSPLHTAAANGYIDIARMLIESGVNVDCHDNKGFTPLYVALRYHQMEAARFLIVSGANISVIDSNMLSLLDDKITNQQDESTHHLYSSRLVRSKLTDITREDRQRERSCLKESGYTDQVQDKETQLQAILNKLSFDSNLPEMIYEELDSIQQSTNSCQLIEDEYDTIVNMRKMVDVKLVSNASNVNGVTVHKRRYNRAVCTDNGSSVQDQSSRTQEQLYDDTKSVRQSMGLSNTNNPNLLYEVDENGYDDASSVRQSMGLSSPPQLCNIVENGYDDASSVRQSMGLSSPPQLCNIVENGYDDASSVRQSMGLSSTNDSLQNCNDEELYDDATSVRQSVEKLDENDEMYDDAITIRQSMSIQDISQTTTNVSALDNKNTTNGSIDNNGLYNDAGSVKAAISKDESITDSVSCNDKKSVPQPYEQVKIRSKNVKVTESLYSSITKRKTTTRRKKLPSSDAVMLSSQLAKQNHRPLVSSISVGYIQPTSLERSPKTNKRQLSEQVTMLSPNVPIAWQYRKAALSKESDQLSPTHQQSYHSQQQSAVQANNASVYQETSHNPSSTKQSQQSPSQVNSRSVYQEIRSSPPHTRHLLTNSSSPLTSGSSSPNSHHSPIFPREYSVFTSRISPPPQNASPTYTSIPEQRDIYSSFSSGDSGEYSTAQQSPYSSRRITTNNSNNGSVSTKMKLTNRQSVPAIGYKSRQPLLPPVTKHTSVYNAPQKPLRLSNPFQT